MPTYRQTRMILSFKLFSTTIWSLPTRKVVGDDPPSVLLFIIYLNPIILLYSLF